MASSKGKGKESWSSGWWDFYPLVEHPSRPVEWSTSCVIFTAHPTQPIILARHFSSSKQFNLPPPTPVMSSSSSYDPPTIISVSPNDDWLFAYYPGRSKDGAACIWKRGPEIDSWTVQEFWSLAPNAGIVSATWLGTGREWTSVQSGASTRLDPQGPPTPVSNPTLALVTQNHHFTLCYFRSYIPTLKMMTCPLHRTVTVTESRPNNPVETPSDLGTVRLCVKAAIGLGYRDSTILVATRSHVYPAAPSAPAAQFNAMELNLPIPMDLGQTAEPMQLPPDACGEEALIEMCEIRLIFDTHHMRLMSAALPSLRHSSSNLTNLAFVAQPSAPSVPQSKKPAMYLAASFLDFGNFSTIPKSDVVLYSFSREPLGGDKGPITLKTRQEAIRQYSNEVVSFVIPSKPSYEPNLFVGFVSTSGDIPPTKPKVKIPPQVTVGSIRVLRIPDLAESETWDSMPILSSIEKAGRDVTRNAGISPNEALVCTMTSTPWIAQTSVLSLPKRKAAMDSSYPALSAALARAVALRKPTADLTHTLSQSSTSLKDMANILYHTYTILESQENGQSGILIWEAVGLTIEVYRTRANKAEKEAEKENLIACWESIHDMCSLVTANVAFENCKEKTSSKPVTYDLSAVWQLVGLSSWVVSFAEKLLKECVLSYEPKKPSTDNNDDLFGSDPSSPTQLLDTPVLLHLCHPEALRNLKFAVGHVHHFRNHLKSLMAGGENAQIARDVLVDTVDCSGVDLGVLETLLASFMDEVKTIGVDEARRILAASRPTPATQPYLRRCLLQMSESKVVDKPRLFIKPFELVDGIGQLELEGPKKDHDKDVVSKALLTKQGARLTCLRCGGKSEIKSSPSSPGHPSVQWQKTWVKRCICGGTWVGKTTGP
ncbi:hypothetical protein C8J56DRAFT_262447 [Mycena floridula]|nr:hypothetical protein C8J56DRAFT_262447 [Mycena floridula]